MVWHKAMTDNDWPNEFLSQIYMFYTVHKGHEARAKIYKGQGWGGQVGRGGNVDGKKAKKGKMKKERNDWG